MTGRPLDGVRVVVLRVGDGDDALAAALRDRGAEACTVRVATVLDRPDADLGVELAALDRFAWVAVTSANAARRLAPFAASWPRAVRIASVGPATTRAIEAAGLHPDVEAADGTASSLAREIDGGPVLFLASSAARSDLVDALGVRGIDVTSVTAYDVVPRELDDRDDELLGDAEVIVATSPSCVDALVGTPQRRASLRTRPLVAIGPTTASHARALGIEPVTSAASRDAVAVAEAVQSVVS